MGLSGEGAKEAEDAMLVEYSPVAVEPGATGPAGTESGPRGRSKQPRVFVGMVERGVTSMISASSWRWPLY